MVKWLYKTIIRDALSGNSQDAQHAWVPSSGIVTTKPVHLCGVSHSYLQLPTEKNLKKNILYNTQITYII